MKKLFGTASMAVFGMFLAYTALGPAAKIARADDGQSGNLAQVSATGTATAGESENEAQVQDSENLKNQLEHQADAQKNALEHQLDAQKNALEHQLDAQKNALEHQFDMEEGDQNITSTSSLENSIKHREQELEDQVASTTDSNEQDALKNQNEVRLTVHALLSSKDLLGGIGPEVSQIAQQMNGSVSSTVSAEAKINARNWFTRFLFGGDQQSAASIQSQVDQNTADIQKLNNLISSCQNCSADVKTILQDRLNIALAEQTRLAAVAKAEADSRGLVNIILGLFGGGK